MLDPAPRSQISLGATTITYLPDGEVHLDPAAAFPASGPDGWAAYAPYLDVDGRLPVSVGSFLIRSPAHRILVDLGLGRVDFGAPGPARRCWSAITTSAPSSPAGTSPGRCSAGSCPPHAIITGPPSLPARRAYLGDRHGGLPPA
jgi:hypothetical protein